MNSTNARKKLPTRCSIKIFFFKKTLKMTCSFVYFFINICVLIIIGVYFKSLGTKYTHSGKRIKT